MRQMVTKAIAEVKSVLSNLIGIVVAVGIIFSATLPDSSPFETTQFTMVKFNNELLVSIVMPKKTNHSANLVLYSGSGFIGELPVPSGGQREVEATFNLPASLTVKNDFDVTAYWVINTWQNFIIEQEIYQTVEVLNASPN